MDLLQNKDKLGLKLRETKKGTYISEILKESQIEKCNPRRARTFPENQVQKGDQIININQETNHLKFEEILVKTIASLWS